jgi:hypothetical protein
MSLIICPKHGDAGFCLRFSKRVVDTIRADHSLGDDQLSLFHIVLIDDEDGEELFTETYLLMKEEFVDMGTPSKVHANKEEIYDAYKRALPDLSGICSECFREYKEKHHAQLLGFN